MSTLTFSFLDPMVEDLAGFRLQAVSNTFLFEHTDVHIKAIYGKTPRRYSSVMMEPVRTIEHRDMSVPDCTRGTGFQAVLNGGSAKKGQVQTGEYYLVQDGMST